MKLIKQINYTRFSFIGHACCLFLIFFIFHTNIIFGQLSEGVIGDTSLNDCKKTIVLMQS